MENYSGWEQQQPGPGAASSSRQPSEMDVDEGGAAGSTSPVKKGGGGKKPRAPAKPREKKVRSHRPSHTFRSSLSSSSLTSSLILPAQ